MCKKGKIDGVIKEKGAWMIPDDAQKPVDGRVSSGKYIKSSRMPKGKVKPLPIGISDYVRAQEGYYYVDKTLLIKEFLDQKPLGYLARILGNSIAEMKALSVGKANKRSIFLALFVFL